MRIGSQFGKIFGGHTYKNNSKCYKNKLDLLIYHIYHSYLWSVKATRVAFDIKVLTDCKYQPSEFLMQLENVLTVRSRSVDGD